MKKVWNWLKQSNRLNHLVGGILVGAGANSLFCALYAGIGIAGALEWKDKQWGGAWDWADFALTAVGSIVGYALRVFILYIK
jgi:hypothetical protein